MVNLADKSELKSYIRHTLVFTLIWLVLTKATLSSMIIGIVVIPLASALSVRLFREKYQHCPYSLNWFRWMCFLPTFLIDSFKGGWQTAKLALFANAKLKPGFIRYSITLPDGRPRITLIHLLSLLPGTVSARIRDNTLLVHALVVSQANYQEIIRYEQHVATLFNVNLDKPTS